MGYTLRTAGTACGNKICQYHELLRMSNNRGIMDLDSLAQSVHNSDIETVIVAFPDLYGRLMGKRFDAEFFLKTVVSHGTHACDYLLTVDMEMEPVSGYNFSNWATGYGDFHLVPNLNTLRVLTWQEKTAFVLCDVQNDTDHALIRQAPRSILRAQIEAIQQLGFGVKAASELEYFIFQNDYADLAKNGYRELNPTSQYIQDYHIMQATREEPLHAIARRQLKEAGVFVESTKGEWGKGQHELNLEYCDVLDMSDRHVLLKQGLKEIADSMGVSVTFMAKYSQHQAGSSCHIHVSLWKDEANAFVGDSDYGTFRCSDEFRWFLGGWIRRVPELMVFYAPNVNSYKRYQSGSWAPTSLAVSQDNRTAGFRIVGSGPSLRIECRIPGADVNPYLVYAAAIASGMDGIRNQIEPPAIFHGNAYEGTTDHVPTTFHDAVELFSQSEFAPHAFGEDVFEHYRHFFQVEVDAYNNAVTDWERIRYFERI